MTAHANTPTTIIADKSADKSLQPIVLPTASGITSVNIATPNEKGLSNNHYSQFDVGSTGAVLNNNRKATNTQIAGFVAANPLYGSWGSVDHLKPSQFKPSKPLGWFY